MSKSKNILYALWMQVYPKVRTEGVLFVEYDLFQVYLLTLWI